MILSRLLGQTLAIKDVTAVLLKHSKEIQNHVLLLTILQDGYLAEDAIVLLMDHGVLLQVQNVEDTVCTGSIEIAAVVLNGD